MANKKISYTTRDFEGLRTELINFTRTYYPDLIDNVNDAAIFSVLLDLNAAVTDNLHFNIDRSIQETVLQYAQQRSSIYNIARTYGLKVPGQRPSVALVDFSITVPAFGDKEDLRYCGILRRGSQVNGAGQVFETVYDIDFSSAVNGDGYPNRLVIPNFDSSNILINYTIVKRETVVNGITKVFKKSITPNDVKPFFELFLPEKNVLGVTSVLLKDGTEYANVPSAQEFIGLDNRWYEVQALAQDRVFVEDPTKTSDTPSSLKSNTTLFVQYRIGGGLSSNVGVNVITQIGTISFYVNGPSQTVNTSVINSLRCTNVTAAIGGANIPTTEEVRNLVAFNFAAQNRAVTVNDYDSLIRTMPSQFGAPAKVAITEENNKIKIQMLAYDETGNLTEVLSNTLKNNVANYLSNYRMMNDYISVMSANVIDLKVDVEVVLDSSQNQGVLISQVINIVTEFFSPANRQMGENVYISELRRQIQNENGVITLANILIYNQVGGQYSSSQTSQRYEDPATRQIALIDDTLFAEPNQTYQVRFPGKDITVRVKNFKSVNFS